MSEAQPNAAPHIAVIDDDTELLKLMVLLLRRIGARSTTIADGQEALHYLADNTPDLIILDLMLPHVNGFDILCRIRSDPRFDPVPVLVLSAKVEPRTIRDVLEAGADGYVTKPYVANSLIDRVRLLLASGRQSGPPGSPPAGPA
ncbi:MAG: response regulator transcription factor [Chloroflexota bacterium]